MMRLDLITLFIDVVVVDNLLLLLLHSFDEVVVMFSCRIKKYNKYLIKQERNLVVTNLNIYNFKSKSKFVFSSSDQIK